MIILLALYTRKSEQIYQVYYGGMKELRRERKLLERDGYWFRGQFCVKEQPPLFIKMQSKKRSIK